MYRRLIKPLLFALSVERAHRVVLILLRILRHIPGGRWLLSRNYAVSHPALEREVFGRRFANPVGLAAGFDRDGEALDEWSAMGFGFVEMGTVTPLPQAGNPRPRVFRLPKDRAIINRIGLANNGLERAIRNLRQPHGSLIVGCNIGKNSATPAAQVANDYLKLFRNLYQYADYFSVNISCDDSFYADAESMRERIGRILTPLFDFRRGQNRYRPILLKIPPDLTDEAIDAVTDILIETPLDGIVATNGTVGREGLQTSEATLDQIGGGRLGGAPLTRRTIEIVERIHTRSGGAYPIIGVGGLMTPDDVRAMLAAGADLVQLYTGYIYNGPRFVREICEALIADHEAAEKAAAEAAAAAKRAAEAEAKAAAEAEAAAREAAEAEAEAAAAQTAAEAAPETAAPDAAAPDAPAGETPVGA